MRIYLDACAINRLTDPPSHLRIAFESEAVERILLEVSRGKVQWIASSALISELERNPDSVRREASLSFLRFASEIQPLTTSIVTRAAQLGALGYGKVDALHLAFSEEAQCEVLLTTDDRLLKRAARGVGQPSVRVENPLDYWKALRS